MNSYSGRLAHILRDPAIIETFSSIYDLHILASNPSTPTYQNIPDDIYLFASTLQAYCTGEAHPRKTALLVGIICHFGWYSLLKNEWQDMESMIPILAKDDPSTAINLAHGLSAIAREVAGHGESQRILNDIDSLLKKASPDQQYAQLASMANNAKDHGDYEEAEELYEEALAIGKQNKLALAPVLFQLGRLELELGRNLERAIKLFDDALQSGFEDIGEEKPWKVRVYISKIQALFAINNMPEALFTYRKAIEFLPSDQLILPAEGGLHHALIPYATIASNHLAAEWLSRMLLMGHILSGLTREREAAISELGRSMTNLGFPSEVEILFRYAKKYIDEIDIGLSRSPNLANIANAYRIRGNYDAAIKFFKEAVDESKVAGELDTRISVLPQLALTQRLAGYSDWQETITQLQNLKKIHNIDDYIVSVQLGILDAIDLLETPPESLRQWPEALRRSRMQLTGELTPLQNALNRRVAMTSTVEQQIPAAGGTISVAEMMVRGAQAGSIMNEGYMTMLKSLIGLNPSETLEWVFLGQSAIEIQKRLFLESLIDLSGNSHDQRYAAKPDGRDWVAALPKARAIIARWLYEMTRSETTPDLTQMKNFYWEWRREDISADVIDPQRDHKRVRSPELGYSIDDATKVASEYTSKLMDSFQSIDTSGLSQKEVLQKVMGFAGLIGSKLSVDQGTKFFDSRKMGMHENNYLDFELFDVLNTNHEENSVFVLDLMQQEGEVIWILAKLGNNYDTTYVSTRRIAFSRKQAGNIIFSLQEHIRREQSGLLDNPHLLENYRSIIYDKLAKITQPLDKLMTLVPADASVYLRLSSPWSAVPVEQLPAFEHGLGLIDKFRITRRDSFGSWMRASSKVPVLIEEPSEVLLLGFEGEGDSPLPVKEHHETLKGLFRARNISGKSAISSAFPRSVVGAKIIDFFGHGELVDGLGAREIFVTKLADGDLLAQEVVAENISMCRLFVLNSCRLAMHKVSRDHVTSAIPNFADHLISGGINSVVAALHVLNANDVIQTMSVFYKNLASNMPLSLAAREAWGLDARMKTNKMLVPVALFGADQKFTLKY